MKTKINENNKEYVFNYAYNTSNGMKDTSTNPVGLYKIVSGSGCFVYKNTEGKLITFYEGVTDNDVFVNLSWTSCLFTYLGKVKGISFDISK